MARAKAHGMGERRRRRLGAGLLGGLPLILGFVAVLAAEGPGPDTRLETVSGGLDPSPSLSTSVDPATTTTTSTATSASPAPVRSSPAPVATPSSNARATTPSVEPAVAAPTTSTTLSCRDSSDPACGPRSWDPAPGPNQPLKVEVTVAPAAPNVGETVTFHVIVDDPDGSRLLDTSERAVDYGDGTPFGGVGGHVDCVGGAGPWTTPAPVPVHEELTFHHVYLNAGTYTVTFTFRSLGDCAYAPSEGTATATVTVAG